MEKKEKKKLKQEQKVKIKYEELKNPQILSPYCLSVIFRFIPQAERFQYRLVNQEFNRAVLNSVQYLNLSFARLKMESNKKLMRMFKHLKTIQFPSMYKHVKLNTLVGKRKILSLKSLGNIKFNEDIQMSDLKQYYPNLDSLNLFCTPTYHTQLLTEFNLPKPCQISEFIINSNKMYDLRVLKLYSDQITSLIIIMDNSRDQVIQKIMNLDCTLVLSKLYIRQADVSDNAINILINFLNQQQNIKSLYINIQKQFQFEFKNSINNNIILDLDLLILENITSVKTFKFSGHIKRVIVQSPHITITGLKYLFDNLIYFDELDISHCSLGWMQFLWQQKKYRFIQQPSWKTIKLLTDETIFKDIQQEALKKQIKVYNLYPIMNLEQIF